MPPAASTRPGSNCRRQFSTACALAALFDAGRMLRASVVTAALSTDAIMGSTQPLQPAIHALRGHPGQIDVARAMVENRRLEPLLELAVLALEGLEPGAQVGLDFANLAPGGVFQADQRFVAPPIPVPIVR